MADLTLYNNVYSVCSMKARLSLEEKGLQWTSHEIDIVKGLDQFQPWYIEMNARAVVPTLKSGDKVITNSAQIIRFVSDLPGGKSLMPTSDGARRTVNEWIDRGDSVNLQTLSYANHPSFEQSEAILNARIARAFEYSEKYPKLADRYLDAARRVLSYKQRESKEEVDKIEKTALRHVDSLEKQLAASEYIVGDFYSLADVIWTVLLARFDLLKKPQLIGVEAHPHVAAYYERMKARPTFASANVQNSWWFTK
jgi:ganglioside-induced differentiation-associated protein 1